MKLKYFFSAWLIVLAVSPGTRADTLITDFHDLNPMSFAYPSSTWVTPVNQFQFFTNGSVLGQEVLPIGGGNPTVSGGAGVLGLSLDLSGATALQLDARWLPASLSPSIQVLLFDADGTTLRFTYASNSFNTVTFSSAAVTFSSATTTAAGSTPGFDLAHVSIYEVQGNFYSPGGAANASFAAQLDNLMTVQATPEPSSTALIFSGALCFAGVVLVRRQQRSAGR